jgi:hypothetical protein
VASGCVPYGGGVFSWSMVMGFLSLLVTGVHASSGVAPVTGRSTEAGFSGAAIGIV